MDAFARLSAAREFGWDDGNSRKNWERHRVTKVECEEAFAHRPLVVARDETHSKGEQRFALWGRTSRGRRLVIVFTLRGKRVRVISARDMNRAERKEFEHAEEAQGDS